MLCPAIIQPKLLASALLGKSFTPIIPERRFGTDFAHCSKENASEKKRVRFRPTSSDKLHPQPVSAGPPLASQRCLVEPTHHHRKRASLEARLYPKPQPAVRLPCLPVGPTERDRSRLTDSKKCPLVLEARPSPRH